MMTCIDVFKRRAGLAPLWLGFAMALLLIACGGGGEGASTSAGTGALTIKTMANRADMISDGDALVEIIAPAGANAGALKVSVDATDVSSAFARRDNGRILGVLKGLPAGKSIVSANLGTSGARLEVTNTGRGGPIFSGPQIQPWVCSTKEGSATVITVPGTSLTANAASKLSGLATDPVDSKCNVEPHFTYYYQPASTVGTGCTPGVAGAKPCHVAYAPPARPADNLIADFTNDRGDKVKALLRMEEGSIDRGQYQILSYFDPAAPSEPWAPQKGWNAKLFWRFGHSATGIRFERSPSAYSGAADSAGIWNSDALAAGFMVAMAQLTNNNDNNNQVLAAEQMMMIKEHIVDTYGEIRYTMSDGISGGSMMQHTIASIMPGLLQGIQPGLSFPDSVTTWMQVRECSMLGQYYKTPAGSVLNPGQITAIEGHPDNLCPTWYRFTQLQDPALASNCGSGFPASLVYDPVLRPNGVRCGFHDTVANVLGTVTDIDRNVKTRLPYDNVGVQYGLKALVNGNITPEEFVKLNEGIGAFDYDNKWTGGNPATPAVPALRFRAVPDGLKTLYQSGMVSNAKNLAKVAIIDLRPEMGVDLHMSWHSTQLRARLDAANGHHDNHVIRVTSKPSTFLGAAFVTQSFKMMDRWLSAIESDKSEASIEQKVVRNKPVDARDVASQRRVSQLQT